MKIGIDMRLWGESGVGRYIRNLISELAVLDKKNEYVLFCLRKDEPEILKQVQNDKFRIVQANIRWHTVAEQVRLPSILNKENLDLVHFPYFSVSVFYRKPFVVTIHDLIINHFDTGEASTLPVHLYKSKRFAYRFVIDRAVKNSVKIITVSHVTEKEIIDHYKVEQNKIVVTYEGVDEKISKKSAGVASFPPQGWNSYFLYVGNAYPHKNLKTLIDAFKNLLNQKDMSKDLKLVMVGKEDFFYKKLKDYVCSLGIEDKVLFCGYVTDNELSKLYKNAKALISPSFMEGFDLPVLEAMSNNCLVLLSDIPVHKEILGENGIYFDPLNTKDMVEKMEAICLNDSNHFTNLVKQAFNRSKEFSWKNLAEQTLEVYESCHRVRPGEQMGWR